MDCRGSMSIPARVSWAFCIDSALKPLLLFFDFSLAFSAADRACDMRSFASSSDLTLSATAFKSVRFSMNCEASMDTAPRIALASFTFS